MHVHTDVFQKALRDRCNLGFFSFILWQNKHRLDLALSTSKRVYEKLLVLLLPVPTYIQSQAKNLSSSDKKEVQQNSQKHTHTTKRRKKTNTHKGSQTKTKKRMNKQKPKSTNQPTNPKNKWESKQTKKKINTHHSPDNEGFHRAKD